MATVKYEDVNQDLGGGKLASLNEFKVCLSCPGSYVNRIIKSNKLAKELHL